VVPPLTLVLLPGLDGTGLQFGPLIAALPDALRPLVLPYPLDRALGYEALAAEVFDRLPRGERFVLLGESFGGPLAMMVAARRPQRLVGVVLCATFVTIPKPWAGPLLRPFVGTWPMRLYPAYRHLRSWAFRSTPPGSWAATAESSERVAPTVLALRVRAVFSVDARAALAACAVPILYLRAAHDRLVPPACRRQIQQVRADVEAVTIPSGHQLLQRRPTECVAATERFAERL
jgi:pimeloyl-[acyl-carrier protein] methyl ester esterase